MYDIKKYKEKYIASLADKSESLRKDTVRLFEKIAKTEEAADCDILDMQLPGVFSCLSCLSYKSVNDIPQKMSILNQYSEFHGKYLIQAIDQKTIEATMKREGYRFISYDEMKQIEKEINNSLSSSWMYNAIIFCLYYGINNIIDLYKLRKSDVDFEKDIIFFESGRLLNMQDKPELRYYLKQVIENNSYYAPNISVDAHKGFYEDSVFKVVRYLDGDDGFKDAFYHTLIVSVIKRINAVYNGEKINRATIYESGLIGWIVNDIRDAGQNLDDYIFAKPKTAETKFLLDHAKQYGCAKNITQIKKMLADYDHYIKQG